MSGMKITLFPKTPSTSQTKSGPAKIILISSGKPGKKSGDSPKVVLSKGVHWS